MNARLILTGLIAAAATVNVHAQLPILFYDFSNVTSTTVPNLGTDLTSGILTGAAIIATGGPTNGFSGGPAGNILTLDGGVGSYVATQIPASTLGFTTDNYTASAWVRLNSFGGDSMVFGQPDDGLNGTYLHNGIRNDNPHMGHWGNDTTGSTNLNSNIGVGNWFHLTFRYSGDEQSIYVNGNLVARENRGNLPNLANAIVGSAHNDGGLPGALDDVAIYNSSLTGNQIAFLANGGNPNALPAPTTISNSGYLGALGSISPTTQPSGPSVVGGSGMWAVREVADSSNAGGIPDNLLHAVDVLKNPPAGFTVVDGFTSTINRRDPQSGASHFFFGDTPFLTDTGTDDNRRAFLYRALVKVTNEGDYTFGYHGDDGFALRIGNHEWTSTSPGAGGLGRIDSDDRRNLVYPVGTGDADMRGVIHLTPGEHQIELVSWEGVGGGSHELYYARGSFINDGDTATWRLVGTDSTDNTLNIPRVTGGWNVTTSTPSSSGNLTTIAGARAALAATGTTVNGVASINYNDPGFGGPGAVAGDVPFPKDTAGVDDEDYAILASGILHIDVADRYRIGFEGDDGGYLRISGIGANPGTADDWTIVENATGLAYVADVNGVASSDGDTLWADVLTGNSRTIGEVFLAPGDYSIESLFFERGGGSYFEVYVTEPDTGTALQLLSSTSQNVDLSTGNLQIVPEPTSIAMMLGGFGALLGFQRLRRRH